MNLHIWVVVLFTPTALALYHELSAEYFVPPNLRTRRADTFFGYSITYDAEHASLIVSSPAENNIGVVYKCDLKHRKCSKLPSPNIARISPNHTHNYLFGATVKAGPNFVVACAPRVVECNPMYNEFGQSGRCYYYKNGTVTLMKPMDGFNRNTQEKHEKLEQTMDSFGWSIDVGSTDAVIIGGPGMFNGRALLYNNITQIPNFLKKNDYTGSFNFGYSVAAGTFINDDLFFAVSSTYGKIGDGQVNFYKGIQWSNRLSKKVDLTVVGSMFGAVLCAAVLNGNRTLSTSMRTDLLVGAPTYATDADYNIGAVYVYLAIHKGRSPTYKRKIVGQAEGSMFGSAICNMRDLNGDNKDEIAIGAPFENERGAVYIYSGLDIISDRTEKTLRWLQRIEPSRPYQSFGSSLTRIYDSDENGCDELAIGAPYSDVVVVLRCMAAVTVKLITRLPKLQNRAGQTDFIFHVCLLVDYPKTLNRVIASLSTTVEMIHPFAKLIKPEGAHTFNTSLEDKKKEYCQPIPFTLPRDGNYETEIDIVATSTLLHSPIGDKHFNSARVVLSDQSELKLQDSLWATECAGKECEPKLHLDTSSSINDNYVIGSSEKEWVSAVVSNKGEVAYDACLRLRISGVAVLKPSSACVTDKSKGEGVLLCAPAKPIWNNSTWSTGRIELDMNGLTNKNRLIKMEAWVYNRCKEGVSKDQETMFTLQPDYSGIRVVGVTNIGDLVNITTDEVLYNGKQMEHMYTITKIGVTNWESLTAMVTLPKEKFIKYNTNPASLYVDNILKQNCKSLLTTTDKFHYIECTIESLAKQVIKIIVPMDIIPGALDGIIGTKNITLNSSISVTERNDPKMDIKQSITTTFTLTVVQVELWVIILASLIGLCILVIIAFILYEIGFLRRKNKEKLQNLKKSVYRQSMRRSMMVRSVRSERPNDDVTQIMDHQENSNQ